MTDKHKVQNCVCMVQGVSCLPASPNKALPSRLCRLQAQYVFVAVGVWRACIAFTVTSLLQVLSVTV
jgi:hypothetical protein